LKKIYRDIPNCEYSFSRLT